MGGEGGDLIYIQRNQRQTRHAHTFAEEEHLGIDEWEFGNKTGEITIVG